MPSFPDFHAWIRTSLEVSHGYAEDCVKDIPDHRLAEQPAGLVNHGAWTMSHLADVCPLDIDRARYPARDDLITALHDAPSRSPSIPRCLDAASLDAYFSINTAPTPTPQCPVPSAHSPTSSPPASAPSSP
jgi:hypothetical protein